MRLGSFSGLLVLQELQGLTLLPFSVVPKFIRDWAGTAYQVEQRLAHRRSLQVPTSIPRQRCPELEPRVRSCEAAPLQFLPAPGPGRGQAQPHPPRKDAHSRGNSHEELKEATCGHRKLRTGRSRETGLGCIYWSRKLLLWAIRWHWSDG